MYNRSYPYEVVSRLKVWTRQMPNNYLHFESNIIGHVQENFKRYLTTKGFIT